MELRKNIKMNRKFQDFVMDNVTGRSRCDTNEFINITTGNNTDETINLESDIININLQTNDVTINENTNTDIVEDYSTSMSRSGRVHSNNNNTGTDSDNSHPPLLVSDVIPLPTATTIIQSPSELATGTFTHPSVATQQITSQSQQHIVESTPIWVTQLFNNINDLSLSLTNKIELNNAELKQANIDLANDLANKIESKNMELSHKITNIDIKINETIRSYVSTLDSKISTLTDTVVKNTDEIKEIKKSYNNFENKIHQAKNESKAELFKTITELQRNTAEVVVEQCKQVENRLITQINVIEDKITQTQEDNITHINELKLNLNDKIVEVITDNQTIKLHQVKIDHHDEQLSKINKTLEQHSEDIKNQSTPISSGQIPNILIACPGNNGINFDQPMPKFDGRCSNPNSFLHKLHKYYERTLASLTNKDPIDHMIDIIELALEHHASKWFSLIKDDINSWNDFENAFLLKYWSRESQRAIKQKIEQEHYRDTGKLSRAEYFIEKVITLRSILPPMNDDEIVTCLTSHFDEIIKNSIRVQNVKTIKELEFLLQREDLRTEHTRVRSTPMHNNRPNHYSSPAQSRNQNFNQSQNRPNNQPQFNNDRRMPPNYHQAYPPRQHNGNQNHYHPYSPHQDYRHGNWSDPRRPYSPPHQDYRHRNWSDTRRPHSPPPRCHEPHAALILRDSPSRRYPSSEQIQTCTAITEHRTDVPHNPNNTPPHTSHQRPASNY